MKTKEELNTMKEEIETLNKKLAELSEDELAQVSGGTGILIPKGEPLEVKGGEGSGTSGGGADIFVPQDSTLIIVGDGKLKY